MRNTIPLMIAAALVVSAPALAQDTNNTAATDATMAGNAVGTGDTMDSPDAVATAPMNGLTADSAPETSVPGAIDTTVDQPVTEDDDDGGFPWGLLGLLGLVGLIPRKNRNTNVNDR